METELIISVLANISLNLYNRTLKGRANVSLCESPIKGEIHSSTCHIDVGKPLAS